MCSSSRTRLSRGHGVVAAGKAGAAPEAARGWTQSICRKSATSLSKERDPNQMLTLTDDGRWTSFGVTPEFIEERSNWLKEKRALHSSSLRFFETAASLVSFARYDYL